MARTPEEFSIAAQERGGGVELTLRGELDLATAPELEQLVNERIDAGDEVVVDLRALEFMDSSGIRVLVAAHARAGRGGTKLVVVRPPTGSAVAKIVEVSGLDGELNLVDDPPSAA
jgi:anti-sigma B factor antagonist